MMPAAEARSGCAARWLSLGCSSEWLRLTCGILLQAAVAAPSAAANQASPPVLVTCAPERPVATVGETIAVRAWVTNAHGEPLAGTPRLTWRATSGKIAGGGQAAWSLDNVVFSTVGTFTLLVPLTATVDVDAPGYGRGRCELEVLVRAQTSAMAGDPASARRRAERLTARMLLVRGKTEATEYGLRSYLIFSTPPRDEVERERYLKAIDAYVRVLVPAEDLLAQNVRASRLNVTMFPAVKTVELPESLDDPSSARAVAVELLAAYDYARARELLSDLGISAVGRGPYLISREVPPSASAGRLLIDMTGVSPALIWDWMTWFCWLSGQERSWSELALKQLGLNLRNIIAVTGSVTPVVFESLGQSLHVLKRR